MAEGEMAESTEGGMTAPEQLPPTGSGIPAAASLLTALMTLGAAGGAALLVSKRKR